MPSCSISDFQKYPVGMSYFR